MTDHWRQGMTLVTRITERFTAEQWMKNEGRERRMVFRHFTSADEGRGRELVAEFRSAEDAARCVACVNAHDELLGFIEALDQDAYSLAAARAKADTLLVKYGRKVASPLRKL